MDAPVDIIISIINRHKDEARVERVQIAEQGGNLSYIDGRIDAFEDLLGLFEGLKRLFA